MTGDSTFSTRHNFTSAFLIEIFVERIKYSRAVVKNNNTEKTFVHFPHFSHQW